MRELSLHILDIVTNSIEANATRVIVTIEQSRKQNYMKIRVRDNGKGMSSELLERVLDPFVTTRTTRSVGMGLSLFRQAAEQTGGFFSIDSALGKGTTTLAQFTLNSLNRSPLGDIAHTIMNLCISNLDIHFKIVFSTDHDHFSFDSYWIFGRMEESEKTLYEMMAPGVEHINSSLEKRKFAN